MIIKLVLSLFLAGTAVYFLTLILIIIGLLLTRARGSRFDVKVSVLIPFRNEKENLPGLIASLEKLTYPEENYEVIFINDGSTDGGEGIIEPHLGKHENWKILEIEHKPEHLQGKKHGITEAIRISKGEVILTTDADCLVPPDWIQSMAGCLTDQTGMVVGHSPLVPGKGFLWLLQSFDNLCGDAAMIAGAYYNQPSHSNGRNLMYRKSVFYQVGGFSENGHIDSGDDFFLSQTLRTKSDYKFAGCVHPDSYVFTKPLPWGEKFIHQQLRRDGKAFYYSPGFLALAFAIALHVLLLPVMFLINLPLWFYLIVLGLKIFLEFSGVWVASAKLKKEFLRKWYPVMGVCYPIWIFLFSLLGSLRLYKWK